MVQLDKDSMATVYVLRPLSVVIITEDIIGNSSLVTGVLETSLNTPRNKSISVQHMEEAIMDMVTAGRTHTVKTKA